MHKYADVHRRYSSNGSGTYQSRRAWSRRWFLGPLALAALSALTAVLTATPASAGNAATAHAVGYTAPLIPAGAESRSAAANAAVGAQPTAGGVLGDVTGDGLADILAIDPAGNLWLYPNTGSAGAGMFAGGRSKVGTGWAGYTLAAVAPLYGATRAGILAIDPTATLWYYPNTGGTGTATFGARSKVGTGWNGYVVAGVGDLSGTGAPGLMAIANVGPNVPGTMLYYPSKGGTGLNTFTFGTQIGQGWTGYTADFADINGDGRPDILAVDPSGNLWLYPNSGVTSPPFAPRSRVGLGWNGYQAIDVGRLTSTGPAGILAIDPIGNLWFYPNTGGTGFGTFGARTQVGRGWTGYSIN